MSSRRRRGAFGAKVVAALLQAGAGLIGMLRRRRELKDLTQLDDRLLRDIGVSRVDVLQALSAPLSDDPWRELTRRRCSANETCRASDSSRRLRDTEISS